MGSSGTGCQERLRVSSRLTSLASWREVGEHVFFWGGGRPPTNGIFCLIVLGRGTNAHVEIDDGR